MKKIFFIIFLSGVISFAGRAQLAVVKMVGKNASNSNIGFGFFAYWDLPLNETGNRSVMIELFDLSFFEPKDSRLNPVIGFVSIRIGYRYIFSQETKTGFYLEPSAGYARVVNKAEFTNATYGDGIALAAEGGYTLETGERRNNLTFGVKFEKDMAGGFHKLSSVGLRCSYAFHLFRKRGD